MPQTSTADDLLPEHCWDQHITELATAPPQQVTPRQIRTLQLTNTLSRDLDFASLAQGFSEGLRGLVPHQGLTLDVEPLGIEQHVGRRGGHRLRQDLALADEKLGAVEVSRDRPFLPEEARELAELSASLIYPLRNAVQYQRALRLVFRDPLTGLNNRAALDLALEREVEQASRLGTPMSLLILDTDGFKEVNDTHGHIVGDRVLRAIADALAKTVRNTDAIHRYGGDEFVVTLPSADAQGALCVAERIRTTVESLRITQGNVHIMASVSVGLAEHRPGEGFAELFQRADQALYRAKELGRNRVVVA